jgi:hypothetical protein
VSPASRQQTDVHISVGGQHLFSDAFTGVGAVGRASADNLSMINQIEQPRSSAAEMAMHIELLALNTIALICSNLEQRDER